MGLIRFLAAADGVRVPDNPFLGTVAAAANDGMLTAAQMAGIGIR